MMRFLFFLLSSCFLISAHGHDASMKQAKKEAQKMAKKGISHLKKELLDETLDVTEQDLLPEEDQGKTFDTKTADQQYKNAGEYVQGSELNQFLVVAQKRDRLDGNEDFLIHGHQIVQNPYSTLDLKAINNTSMPEEEMIETCQEAGTYQISFQQTLHVQLTAGTNPSIKRCKGHQRSKSYLNSKKAKQHVSSKKEKFKKDPLIQSFEVHRDDNKVSCSWLHKDNTESCDHFSMEGQLLQGEVEEEHWETDQAEALRAIESNPSCKLLYSTVLKGPETRLIHERPVHRDIWTRQLFFSCESDTESKCAQLRQQGAVLISKKCLETNIFGECDQWEKIYDLGKKGASQQATAIFQKEALWGLQSEFDTSYEKNTDFGQTLATLSAFSELEHTLEDQGADFHDKVQIFKGENLKCQKSFFEGNVFDCCKKMEGIALSIKLASCKTEEKCLARYRQEGKCHFIGSQKVKLGTVTEHVYCCFPSKLARIIHEQGRKQLGIKWGKADKPKCRGLSLEELQRINFSQIDLSEVIEDTRIDKQAITKKLQQSIEPLQSRVQAQIARKRLELSDKQYSMEEAIDEKAEEAR